MNLGIIRCQQTEHRCPGTKCLQGAQHHQYAFTAYEEEPINLVGFVTCGGCPGKNVDARAAELIKRGADSIALASCISRGNPIDFPCPHRTRIEALVKRQLGENGRFIAYTHE